MITVKIYLGISLELFVEGNVGSVQFQIVLCSSLFFSRSIFPFQCLVNINDRVLIHCTCHLQSGSLFFILASSVCKSLQCVISTLTQGGKGGQLFRLTCSVVLWGREGHCKQISLLCVWSAHSVWTTVGLPPLTEACAFWVYTAQAPGCSSGVLSNVGPVFHALPRSKLLRFKFAGIP